MIDAVQKRLAAVTEKDWNGEKVYLRKLGANQGLAFVKAVGERAEQKLSQADDRAAIILLHATNISKSFCDTSGKLLYDSEDGIAQLSTLPFDELVSLGDLVLNHSGFGADEKKSTQPTNSPPSDSALPLETPIVPTPTTSLAG